MHFLSTWPIVLVHCTGNCSLCSSSSLHYHLLHLLCGPCRPKGEALRASSPYLPVSQKPPSTDLSFYTSRIKIQIFVLVLNSAKEVGGFYKKLPVLNRILNQFIFLSFLSQGLDDSKSKFHLTQGQFTRSPRAKRRSDPWDRSTRIPCLIHYCRNINLISVPFFWNIFFG